VSFFDLLQSEDSGSNEQVELVVVEGGLAREVVRAEHEIELVDGVHAGHERQRDEGLQGVDNPVPVRVKGGEQATRQLSVLEQLRKKLHEWSRMENDLEFDQV
jgi:hypothetical protein